jgi:octopine/nopaline transport system substrate-binding protein
MHRRRRFGVRGWRVMFGLAAAALVAGSFAVSSVASAHTDGSAKPTIVLGTEANYPPWNVTNPNGTVGGFEPQLADILCKEMNVTCKWQKLAFSGLIPALTAGKINAIMDDLSITPDRLKVINFSVPYATICNTFAVLSSSPLASSLNGIKSGQFNLDNPNSNDVISALKSVLKGQTIGVAASGNSNDFVQKYLTGDVTVQTYQSNSARNLDLTNGRINVVTDAKDALIGSAKAAGSGAWKVVGPCFTGGVVGAGAGVGVRKSDPKLLAAFNKAIKATVKTAAFAALSKKYFGYNIATGT